MVKIGLLMIGCAGIAAAPGCVADPSDADIDRTEVVEAELAASTDDPVTNAIGEFHPIRLSNTNLCLQPLGGTTGNANVELVTCNGSSEQHWLFRQRFSSEWQVINHRSGRCLYNGASRPSNGARPITHESCNASGTTNPVTNALWRPTALTGNSLLQSRIGHRDTGFCIDVPGLPFNGIQMQNFRCNGAPAQIFVIGIE